MENMFGTTDKSATFQSDSDSGDSLFVTQSVSSAKSTSKRSSISQESIDEGFCYKGDPQHKECRQDAVSTGDSDSHTSDIDYIRIHQVLSSSLKKPRRHQRSVGRRPTFSFLKSRSGVLSVKQNQTLINAEVGGFFKCMEKLSKGQDNCDSPYVLCPLFLSDKLEEYDDDIKKVDINSFILMNRNKHIGPWLHANTTPVPTKSEKSKTCQKERKQKGKVKNSPTKSKNALASMVAKGLTEPEKDTDTHHDSSSSDAEKPLPKSKNNKRQCQKPPSQLSSSEASFIQSFFIEPEENSENNPEVLATYTQSLGLLPTSHFILPSHCVVSESDDETLIDEWPGLTDPNDRCQSEGTIHSSIIDMHHELENVDTESYLSSQDLFKDLNYQTHETMVSTTLRAVRVGNLDNKHSEMESVNTLSGTDIRETVMGLSHGPECVLPSEVNEQQHQLEDTPRAVHDCAQRSQRTKVVLLEKLEENRNKDHSRCDIEVLDETEVQSTDPSRPRKKTVCLLDSMTEFQEIKEKPKESTNGDLPSNPSQSITDCPSEVAESPLFNFGKINLVKRKRKPAKESKPDRGNNVSFKFWGKRKDNETEKEPSTPLLKSSDLTNAFLTAWESEQQSAKASKVKAKKKSKKDNVQSEIPLVEEMSHNTSKCLLSPAEAFKQSTITDPYSPELNHWVSQQDSSAESLREATKDSIPTGGSEIRKKKKSKRNYSSNVMSNLQSTAEPACSNTETKAMKKGKPVKDIGKASKDITTIRQSSDYQSEILKEGLNVPARLEIQQRNGQTLQAAQASEAQSSVMFEVKAKKSRKREKAIESTSLLTKETSVEEDVQLLYKGSEYLDSSSNACAEKIAPSDCSEPHKKKKPKKRDFSEEKEIFQHEELDTGHDATEITSIKRKKKELPSKDLGQKMCLSKELMDGHEIPAGTEFQLVNQNSEAQLTEDCGRKTKKERKKDKRAQDKKVSHLNCDEEHNSGHGVTEIITVNKKKLAIFTGDFTTTVNPYKSLEETSSDIQPDSEVHLTEGFEIKAKKKKRKNNHDQSLNEGTSMEHDVQTPCLAPDGRNLAVKQDSNDKIHKESRKDLAQHDGSKPKKKNKDLSDDVVTFKHSEGSESVHDATKTTKVKKKNKELFTEALSQERHASKNLKEPIKYDHDLPAGTEVQAVHQVSGAQSEAQLTEDCGGKTKKKSKKVKYSNGLEETSSVLQPVDQDSEVQGTGIKTKKKKKKDKHIESVSALSEGTINDITEEPDQKELDRRNPVFRQQDCNLEVDDESRTGTITPDGSYGIKKKKKKDKHIQSVSALSEGTSIDITEKPDQKELDRRNPVFRQQDCNLEVDDESRTAVITPDGSYGIKKKKKKDKHIESVSALSEGTSIDITEKPDQKKIDCRNPVFRQQDCNLEVDDESRTGTITPDGSYGIKKKKKKDKHIQSVSALSEGTSIDITEKPDCKEIDRRNPVFRQQDCNLEVYDESRTVVITPDGSKPKKKKKTDLSDDITFQHPEESKSSQIALKKKKHKEKESIIASKGESENLEETLKGSCNIPQTVEIPPQADDSFTAKNKKKKKKKEQEEVRDETVDSESCPAKITDGLTCNKKKKKKKKRDADDESTLDFSSAQLPSSTPSCDVCESSVPVESVSGKKKKKKIQSEIDLDVHLVCQDSASPITPLNAILKKKKLKRTDPADVV